MPCLRIYIAQELILSVALGAFVEPNYVVYDVDNQALTQACEMVKNCLQVVEDKSMVERIRAQRITRVNIWNEAILKTVCSPLTTLRDHALIARRLKASSVSPTHPTLIGSTPL